MRQRRYEHIIPRFIAEWHDRWIILNEAKARAWYGDDLVDRKLAGVAGPARDGAAPGGRMPIVDTNRNVAATSTPAPETYQGEIQLAVNPNNPNQIVAAANTWDTIASDWRISSTRTR